MAEDGPVTRRARSVRFDGLALALLLAVAAAPFVTCIVRGETPFFLDLADHWYPLRLDAWRALQAGELPQWCRHAFCGVPLLGQVDAGILYPPHLLLDRIHPAHTLLPQLVGHRFVLGALMYAAARQRRLTRTAAFLAGALAILCGVTTTAQAQLAHLRTLCWLPLLLLGCGLIADRRRVAGAAALAAGTAITFLAGYPALLFRALPLVPILLLLDPGAPGGARRGREWAVRAAWAAAGLALGGATAAVQILPALDFAEASQRAMGLDVALLDHLRAAPADLLMLFVPRTDSDGGVVRAGFAYVGAAAAALAVLACVRRRPGALALAAAALFGLVAALGTATPLGALLLHLPGASSFRNPSQYLVLWALSMPLLAAYGLDAMRDARPSRRAVLAATGAVGAVLAVAAFVPHAPDGSFTWIRVAVACAALLATGAAMPHGHRCAACAVVLAAALADAGSLNFRYTTREGRARPVASLLAPDPEFARVAARHAAAGRVQPARILTSDAVFNWDNHGFAADLENVRGLLSLVPLRTVDVSRIVAEGAPFPRVPPKDTLYDYGPTHALASPLLDLLAVRYAVGYRASPGPGWRAVGPTEWERDAVDPLRFVQRAIAVAPDGDGWRRLAEPGFDAVRDAVVEIDVGKGGALPSGDGPPGTVTSYEALPNGLRSGVEAARDAVLVWTETHAHGWSVAIDGRRADLLRADHAFMAVVVPAGRHEVVWSYESPGLRTGAWISGAALAVWIAAAAAALRRRR